MTELPGEDRGILAAVADASDDAIIVVGPDGVVVNWSRGAARLYGFNADEMVGRPVASLVPEGNRGEIAALLRRVADGERISQAMVGRTKQGRALDVTISISPIRSSEGRILGAVAVAHDVTRQRREERTLRTTELRWRSMVESAVDGIIVIDADGRIEFFNPAAERLFGYSEAEVLGRNVSLLMPPPFRDEHDGYLARYQREGDARIIGVGRDVQGLRRDGSVFPLHLSVGEMSLEGERKFTGILRDLSVRVQLEERLRASEARWRAVIESAVDGIVVIDARGCIEALNPAAERLFGYGEEETIGRNVSMLMPEPYRSEHDGYLERYLREGHARIIGAGREVTGRRKDGSTFPVHLSVGEMSVGGERKFTGILHDLSARVRLEERMREQTALAKLGEMAAVIAHEVRNPLAGIRGAIQMIGNRLPAEAENGPVVKEVLDRIDSLSTLMSDLLLFARPPKPRPRPVEIAPLVTSTADLLKTDPTVGGIQVSVEGSAPPVVVDPGLLTIVFLNLLVNSAQAMKGAGTVRVAVTAADGGCSVAFIDSGPGIPPDIREKLFTPFFTTKARGTGLGLATARRLVEAHRGTIDIHCPPGGGTTVVVQLPLH